MQTLGVIRIQLIYSINVLSKYSSLISHRPSIFEADTSTIDLRSRHIDHRSSKIDISITDLRRSTRRSSKVNTSISEGRHIDLQRSTHRDIDLRVAPHRFSKIEGRNITPTIRHRILSTTALQVLRVDEVTHAHTCIYIYTYKN